MGTYKRTNGVNWCLPAMHKERVEAHNQITEELVLFVLKWVSTVESLEICTIVCGNCHFILPMPKSDVTIQRN
jgi:hypothetical protein